MAFIYKTIAGDWVYGFPDEEIPQHTVRLANDDEIVDHDLDE